MFQAGRLSASRFPPTKGSNHRLGVRMQRVGLTFARLQVFDLANALIQFLLPGDDGQRKAALVGVLQLLAEPFRFGIEFHAQTSGTQLGGQRR